MGYGGKDFDKRKLLRREYESEKRYEKCQQPVHDQSMMKELGDDDARCPGLIGNTKKRQ